MFIEIYVVSLHHNESKKRKDMTLVTEITNEKGNKKVMIEKQDGIFYCSVWVNRGETCTESDKTFKTLKGAEKFANKRMA